VKSHIPIVQVAVPLVGAVQALPQRPQLLVVPSGVSQPLATTPSQLAKPVLQLPIAHAPEVQAAVPLGGAAQVTPHAPQLVVVLVAAHMPLQQLCPGVQRVPHAPQLFTSVCVFAQVPPQGIVPDTQGSVHVPIEQLCPAVQRVPHMPQLFTSVCMFTHASAQLVKGMGQVKPHMPMVQVAVPFVGAVQARPHMPQFAVLVFVLTQVVPHVVDGAMQVVAVHRPALHDWPAMHDIPQTPQFVVVSRAAHIPPQHD
jgi:hypothetical protein